MGRGNDLSERQEQKEAMEDGIDEGKIKREGIGRISSYNDKLWEDGKEEFNSSGEERSKGGSK